MSSEEKYSDLISFIINDSWHFDPKRNLLKHNSDERSYELEHQLVVLLVYFITNQQQILSKEQLLKDNWPGKVVNDENLTVAVSKLRKHFSDNSKQPEVIKTIPGKGYQFVASVAQAPLEKVLRADKFNLLLPIFSTCIVVFIAAWFILNFGHYNQASQALPIEQSANVSELEQLIANSENADIDDLAVLIQAWHSELQRNPEQTLAYWYLAKLKIELLGPWIGERIKHFDELSALLKKTLEYDKTNADAWYWLGNLYFWHKLDFSTAESHLLKAISLKEDPRYIIQYSELLVAQGKFDQVFELAAQVRLKMPNLFAFPGLAWVYQLSGKPERGWLELQRIKQTEIDSYPWHCSAVRISQQLGYDEEGFKSLLWLLENTDKGMPHVITVREIFNSSGLKAVYQYLLDVKFDGDIGHYLPPLSWARYALVAEDPTAEHYFEQAVKQRQLPLLWAGYDQIYTSIHNSKPFESWIKMLND
ncbi:hypothetical protein GCM10010919_01030 [Alishewanella longhuensis]|uniref:OmpR/PhoB-type domain-containing protein n=1 Tax=Alishewanella longhuensis TaxID=1091037 RepID=A0ABQ3KVT1_9ALTE|nr:winged helix-turn-helix domain-containing protein [Alishewanella longhuensis]GHG58938.1 hypothetical protein GCM10010919_01030 [Alishewanella longhuensis]